MGLHQSSPACPARLVAVCAALFLLVLLLAAAAPRAHAQDPEFSALVFSKTTGFRHADAIDAGKVALPELGAANDFSVTLTEDSGQFTDQNLRNFDVIVFLNTDGEGILNAAQRTAVERWMSRGGGIVGIHADANADRDWAWKGDMRGGAWFLNHPSGAQQFQSATVVNEDPAHPAMAGIGATWTRTDEWYNFTAEPRGKVHVLATLDENSYDEQDGTRRRRRPPDRVVLELRRRPGLLHRARPPRLGLAGAAVPLAHPRRHPVGRRRRRGRLRRGAPGPADRRRLRQGDARRQHREPDGDRDRARSQGLHRRARRQGQGVQPADQVRAQHRHDPGASRQRERPPRHHARPGLRHQPVPLPLLQRPNAGDPAHLALHARRRRDDRHGLGEADPRVPAPADHLLPLLRLDGVRARRATCSSRPATTRSTPSRRATTRSTTGRARTCRATRTPTPTTPTTRAARRATRTTCAARSCASGRSPARVTRRA